MSFMRPCSPLRYFKGVTKSYVFVRSVDSKVEDYNDKYVNNASFCELVGRFAHCATGDKEYGEKILRVLAKKLGVEKELRDKPLTTEEWFEESQKLMKEKEKECGLGGGGL